jgi:hypothetical protein
MIGAVTGCLRIDDKPCLLSPFQTSASERIQLPLRHKAPIRSVVGIGQLLPVATVTRHPETSRSRSAEAWFAIDEHHSRPGIVPPLQQRLGL